MRQAISRESLSFPAVSSIPAMRGWQGKDANSLPRGVIRPFSVAPSSSSSFAAPAIDWGGGGVSQGSDAMPLPSQQAH